MLISHFMLVSWMICTCSKHSPLALLTGYHFWLDTAIVTGRPCFVRNTHQSNMWWCSLGSLNNSQYWSTNAHFNTLTRLERTCPVSDGVHLSLKLQHQCHVHILHIWLDYSPAYVHNWCKWYQWCGVNVEVGVWMLPACISCGVGLRAEPMHMHKSTFIAV